jgi:hypothetical protein
MGVEFVGGYQFWSDPSLIDTDKAISIILLRPTLLDMVILLKKYGADRIGGVNERLRDQGGLKEYHYINNKRRIELFKGLTA